MRWFAVLFPLFENTLSQHLVGERLALGYSFFKFMHNRLIYRGIDANNVQVLTAKEKELLTGWTLMSATTSVGSDGPATATKFKSLLYGLWAKDKMQYETALECYATIKEHFYKKMRP